MITKSEKDSQNTKIFSLFLLIHAMVWVIAPLFRINIPMDSAEAIVWGYEWTWGTYKHPPLSGWLAEIMFRVFKNPEISTYILSQICILSGFVFIYKLACCFFDTNKALLCSIFLEGTIYFSLETPEYNVNILSQAIIPALIYFFYKSTNQNKPSDWIMVGIFSGLAILTKYTNVVVILCMGLYLISTKNGRSQFRKHELYFAGSITVLIFLPHFLWLLKNDFYVFDYFAHRASPVTITCSGWIDNFKFPIKFILAQTGSAILTLAMFALIYFKTQKEHRLKKQKPNSFLFFMGILPILIFVLISALGRIHLKSMWGYALVSLLPIILFYCFPIQLTKKTKNTGIISAFAVLFLFGSANIAESLMSTGNARLNGKELASEVKETWNKETGNKPLHYIAGWVWAVSTVAVYLPERPHVMFNHDFNKNPYIDKDDIDKKGAIVITKDITWYNWAKKTFKRLSAPIIYESHTKNIYGKEKITPIYYGILKPLEEGETNAR